MMRWFTVLLFSFFFSSRRRHTRLQGDWSSDVCSSDLFAPAQAHLDQAFALYDPEHHRDLGYHVGDDPGLLALGFAAQTLWYRGYPDQAQIGRASCRERV